MMIYWYPKPSEGKINLADERYQLGEVSFKTFWKKDGFKIFENIINDTEDLTELIVIKDEQGKNYTVPEFITMIEKLKIIQ
jgi:hypothetical protein